MCVVRTWFPSLVIIHERRREQGAHWGPPGCKGFCEGGGEGGGGGRGREGRDEVPDEKKDLVGGGEKRIHKLSMNWIMMMMTRGGK